MAIVNSEHLCYYCTNNTSILPAPREVTASNIQMGVRRHVERDLYFRKELTMKEHVEDEVIYYYDLHPTEEDLMGETSVHRRLVTYLAAVLRWLFHEQVCAVYENLNFYQTRNYKEYPVAPDLAVIKDTPFEEIRSWPLVRREARPQVVFEILSEETWRKDLKEKLPAYEHMGVQEYFAYDPNPKPLARATAKRLFGWRRAEQTGLLSPLQARRDGRLWSTELDSWLAPEGVFLRLYDRHGNLRLTEAEAMAQQVETEAEAREAADRRAQILAEKLRSLGVDPDDL
jgi:Uma2 family endonuclease